MKKLIKLYSHFNLFGIENNFKLRVIQPGEIQYEMKVLPKHLATPTTAHGGVVSALMDSAIGVAALSAVAAENKVVSTIEFKINYFKPALLGDALTGKGKVEHRGKRIIHASGEIYNQKGELIAKALGTLNAYPIEKSDLPQK